MTVLVDVADLDGPASTREGCRKGQRPVAIAKEDRKVSAGRDEIQQAVFIEISCRQSNRAGPCGRVEMRLEGPVAISQQDGYTGGAAVRRRDVRDGIPVE